MTNIKRLAWLISGCVLLSLLLYVFDNWETEGTAWRDTSDIYVAVPMPQQECS